MLYHITPHYITSSTWLVGIIPKKQNVQTIWQQQRERGREREEGEGKNGGSKRAKILQISL